MSRGPGTPALRHLSVAAWPVLVAIGCLGSAVVAPPIPVWLAGGIVVASLLRVRPILIALGLVALCGALATQAQQGSRPLPAGQFDGIVQLTADPSSTASSATATIRTRLGRLRMVAHGAVAGRIRDLSAGDRIRVDGRIDPGRNRDPSRHLRGDLNISTAGERLGRSPFITAIEALRSTVVDGASVLPSRVRPLYLGFVIGDDRGSSPVVEADMEEAGLGHLTVVSGENLAFVLLVLAPFLARFGIRQRFFIIMLALVVFGAVTRFEPSILRATAMACVVAASVRCGRPASAVRIVSLAVIAIVIIDPLIVWSLGFRLSLAATVGIVIGAPVITRRIPGPRRIAQAIAVPVAAQIGVAPIAIPIFGPQPLLAVLANVLVAPAAALVMVWGCTVGVLAGLVGDGPATLFHWPTVLGLEWVLLVARVVSSLPPLNIGMMTVTAGLATCVLWRLVRGRARLAMAVGCAMTVLLAAIGGLSGPTSLVDEHTGGARVWVSAGSERVVVVVMGGDVDVTEVFRALTSAGVRQIDLLVRTSDASGAVEGERHLRERVEVRRATGVEQQPAAGTGSIEQVDLGELLVVLDRSRQRLAVDVEVVSEPGRGTMRG